MKDYALTLLHNERAAQDIHRLTLSGLDEAFFDAFTPGQFAHIAVPGAPQLILRRPVSIASVDREQGEMVLYCMGVGEGTRRLCASREGEVLAVIAPIGAGYPVGRDLQNVCLLGGGMGVAPMLAAAEALGGRRCTAFLGWRDAMHVYAAEEFLNCGCRIKLYTDDGSTFEQGFALDALLHRIEQGERPDAVFSCGPAPMLRALKKRLPPDIPCYVSLEERMGCGVGGCLTCTCKIAVKDGYENRRVCVDGPVFPLSEVVFDD